MIELQAAPGASAVGEPAPAPRPDPARRLALVACGMALGVLIVALAYAGNRDHLRGAAEVYWVGQCVLFGAPAALLLGRRAVSRVEAIGIAVGLPAATYVIKECYSPIQFRFLDELAHVQTAQAILATHHLFHPNTALPVSPQYPGLEIATTALAALSHLSIYAAGTVVVGVAHILLAAGMYLLFLEVTRRPRIACLAVVIYATGPHYAFFDSYFIYEAIALPFMVACLLAVLRARREPRLGIALVWSGVAILCAAATVVSHHVTSWVLLGALICLEATSWRSWRALRSGWPLHATLAVVAAMVGVWDLRISPADVADMATVIGSVTHSLSAHRTKLAVSAPFSPRFDVWMEYLAELTVLVLVGVGGWRLWRTRHRPGSLLRLVAVVGAMGFFAALAIRLRGSNGSQLWGRATTYYLIPVSVMAAVALRRPPPAGRGGRRWLSPRLTRLGWSTPARVVLVAVLVVGGLAAGEPPYYARLPGPYRVVAWERSIDQHNLALSRWAAAELPAGFGVASDANTESMLTSLGHLAGPAGVAPLFLSRGYSAAARSVVLKDRIVFVAVDRRIAHQLPATGYYFTDDPRAGRYRSPIPVGDLTKFNHIAGVSRLYDDGTIVVYDLTGSRYAVRRRRKP